MMSLNAVQAKETWDRYGSYPISKQFSSNDDAEDLPEISQPVYSAAFDTHDGIKRHSACDECRKRKLKCSGEPDGCVKCLKQNLVCHYSEQKQMGRPRKRQKTENEARGGAGRANSPHKLIRPAPEPILQPRPVPSIDSSIDPSLAAAGTERAQFEGICNGPIAQTIRKQRQASTMQEAPGLQSGLSDSSQSYNGAPTPDQNVDIPNVQYPTDVANWPDFSSLDILPLPIETKWRGAEPGSNNYPDPDANPDYLNDLPSVPGCACLPNLYLTLSTLSTLSSFPFTPHTIETLQTSMRTAKSVIYCPTCPQKYSSGSSNLMLVCTLLNVIADQWNRLRKSPPDDLRKGFGQPEQQVKFVTIREGQDWRAFAHEMIRAYCFGDRPVPSPPAGLSDEAEPNATPSITASEGEMVSLTLMGLVDSITRRQRQWHRLDPATDEFPDRVNEELEKGHHVGHEDGTPGVHLCLEIINHARCIVKAMDKEMLT